MKTYTEDEVIALLKKSIELAQDMSFIPYTNGEMTQTYTESAIIDMVLDLNTKTN